MTYKHNYFITNQYTNYSNNTDAMERTRKRLNRGLRTYLLQNNSYAIAHYDFDDSYSALYKLINFAKSAWKMLFAMLINHTIYGKQRHISITISLQIDIPTIHFHFLI
jgi:hypothetical protein